MIRHAILFGVFFQVGCTGYGADRPIPQDTEKMQAQLRKNLHWQQGLLGKAYEKVGHRSPRWDKEALNALDIVARMISLQSEPVVTIEDLYQASKKAVEAGCDDPLILYEYARSSIGDHYPGHEESQKLFEKAARAMEGSQYSDLLKSWALVRSASSEVLDEPTDDPELKKQAQRQLDLALELVSKSGAEEKASKWAAAQWAGLLEMALEVQKKISPNDETAFERIDNALAKAEGMEAVRQLVKGYFYFYWGWKARGQSFANGVTREQFRLFRERLETAKSAFEKACELDPNLPKVARSLLQIDKSIGDGDRDVMEMWFERAMTSDGYDQEACWTKLDWLDPKWHGDSYEDMLAFGRACAATKNWRTGITLLVADAHYRVAIARGPILVSQYLAKPDVWSEIETVYDEYLQHFPKSHSVRSKYACLCAFSGHWAKANTQFQIVGDKLTTWTAMPTVPLEGMKQLRLIAKLKAGEK